MKTMQLNGTTLDASTASFTINGGNLTNVTTQSANGCSITLAAVNLDGTLTNVNLSGTLTNKGALILDGVTYADDAKIVLDGGSIKLQSALGENVTLSSIGGGEIYIADNLTLKDSSVNAPADFVTITISGSGTYDLKDLKTTSKVSGFTESTWSGTVTTSATEMTTEDINALGNSDSTVDLLADSVTLEVTPTASTIDTKLTANKLSITSQTSSNGTASTLTINGSVTANETNITALTKLTIDSLTTDKLNVEAGSTGLHINSSLKTDEICFNNLSTLKVDSLSYLTPSEGNDAGINIKISDEILSTWTGSTPLTLLTIGGNTGYVGKIRFNGADTLNNVPMATLVEDANRLYTLTWDETGKKLLLNWEEYACVWNGNSEQNQNTNNSISGDDVWSPDSSNPWLNGQEPGSNKMDAIFADRGDNSEIKDNIVTEMVTIGKDASVLNQIVTPQNVYIKPEIDKVYIFDGYTLDAKGFLIVESGSVVFNNDVANFAGTPIENEGLTQSLVKENTQLTIGQKDDEKTEVSFGKGLLNEGTVTVQSDGAMTVNGTLTNNDSLTNNGGELVVDGTFENNETTTLIGGTTTVTGVLTNSNALNVNGGMLTVTGTLTNSSSVTQSGGTTTVNGEFANSGSVTLNGGSTIVNGNFVNAANSSLKVDGGSLTVNSITNNGTITLTKGCLTVNGTLKIDFDTVDKDVTLSVGDYNDTNKLDVAGRLLVTRESSVAKLTTSGGGSVGVQQDGKLTLVTDTTLNVQQSVGVINAAGHTLTLEQKSVGAGKLVADTLNLSSAHGSTASDIDVNEINFGTVTAGQSSVLTLNGSVNTSKVLVTLANAAAEIAVGTYNLIEGANVQVGNFYLTDDYEQAVLQANKKITLTQGSLHAVVRALEDADYTWNTSSVDSVAGLHIIAPGDATDTLLARDYATLDSICHIVVDADQTIDLTTIAPEGEGDALVLRDLSGDKTLKLVGNGDDAVSLQGGNMSGGIHLQHVSATATAPMNVAKLVGDADSTLGGTWNVSGSADYSGAYANATVHASHGAELQLAAGTGLMVGGNSGSVTLNYGAAATMDAIKTTGTMVVLGNSTQHTLTLAQASSMQGGQLVFAQDVTQLGNQVLSGTLALNGAEVVIQQYVPEGVTKLNVDSDTTVIADLGNTTATDTTITLDGLLLRKYLTNARLEEGKIVADRNTSYVSEQLEPTDSNASAGAKLLDEVFLAQNPQVKAPEGDLTALLDAVDAGTMTEDGLAAVAGASTAALGMALSGDVERQLRAIRNRTTPYYQAREHNDEYPSLDVWANAEGHSATLDNDGMASGYDLNSWGGTIGFGKQIGKFKTDSRHLSVGMALTAMYGDMSVNGADRLEGDMDTCYVSAFVHYTPNWQWTHTLVATVGTMSGSYERTVNAGTGYKTEGDLDGYSFGLMYELTRSYGGHAEILQPVFNVSLRHSAVDAYTESGSDAALEVSEQSMTTLTFGVGNRTNVTVGRHAFNRECDFELRVLAKADIGDRSSSADVAFPGAGSGASVESAELGAFGVEVGVGFNIPLRQNKDRIFVDGTAEFRSGYSSYNATVGYRVNF